MASSWITAGLLVVAISAFLRRRSTQRRQLPPGPEGWPIIGNLFQLRGKDLWFALSSWNEQYGPLFHLSVAGHSVIVIGSHEAANELLEKRQSLYSNRPHTIVASELLTGGLFMPCMQPNDMWKRMRRAAHEVLRKQAGSEYSEMQETEAVILVDQLLNTPKLFYEHASRASASLVMSILFGLPPTLDSNDYRIVRINGLAERVATALLPGTYLADYFTWMAYLPRWMCPWRRYAESWFARDSAMLEKLYHDVAIRLNNGSQKACFASALIQDPVRHNLSDREAAWLCGTLYAGSTTTPGVINWLILAMVLYPEVQTRAQSEIDRVVGRDRMPTLKDYDNLPYVRAILKETLRWRPIGPLGVPHCTNQDDWYEGHFIPKDTICLVNIWKLNMDPEMYGADVDQFRPERFLGDSGELKAMPLGLKEDGHASFGFGKRACVGRHIATTSLFIEIASILWAFNIRPSKKDGVEVLPDPNAFLDGGVLVMPPPFACEITARSAGVAAVVVETKDRFELPL